MKTHFAIIALISAKAKDPTMARLRLAAFEKIATTLQALRKEEAHAPLEGAGK